MLGQAAVEEAPKAGAVSTLADCQTHLDKVMVDLLQCFKVGLWWDDLQWSLPNSISMIHVAAVSSRQMSFQNYSVLHKLQLATLSFICCHLVDHLASLGSLQTGELPLWLI